MTTTTTKSFFSKDENIDALRKLAKVLKEKDEVTSPSSIITPVLKQLIDLMVGNAERFDEYCEANIEWSGINFISAIREFVDQTPEVRAGNIGEIFVGAYRFLCELEFTQPAEPSFEINKIKSFVQQNLAKFNDDDRHQLVYAHYLMAAHLAKRMISHPLIADFRRFTETVQSAKKLKEEWDQDISTRDTKLTALKDNLKNITTAFNFVGLVHGFQRMVENKAKEKTSAFLSLLALGLLMVSPILAQIGFVVLNIDVVEAHKGVFIYTLPTIIALEVILLYFFRVVLSQFRSVKGQLLQLDLRVSLCQFIQSYAEYSASIKLQDPTALAKFEALIFSGLVTEESGIPSTFDGMEQVANLVKSIRGSS